MPRQALWARPVCEVDCCGPALSGQTLRPSDSEHEGISIELDADRHVCGRDTAHLQTSPESGPKPDGRFEGRFLRKSDMYDGVASPKVLWSKPDRPFEVGHRDGDIITWV